jgi:hypothetical protein
MIENTIFFHGWGYNFEFWHNHLNAYKNTNIMVYNRGYYEEYHKPKLPIGKTQCVTHSAGLLFAAQEYGLSCFDKIIIYAGFESFPNKTALKAMRLGLQKNPEKILHDFYQACGFMPHFLKNTDISRLIDDLKMLEIFTVSKDLQTVNYTAYHGSKDAIIPIPLKNAIIIENAGHLCNLR